MTAPRPLRDGGWRALALLLPLVVPTSLAAQRPFPYRLHGGREGLLLGVGAGTLAAGVAVSAELDVLTPEDIAALDPADINGFDRPATRRWAPTAGNASDALLVATVGGSLALLATARGPGEPTTLAVMFGETILLTNGVGQLSKTVFRRVRPYAYNDDPDIPPDKKMSKNARQSFPSGHAANAFASAVFLSTVYSRLHPESSARLWIWGGSLAAAGTVGYLRYSAGKHFPTDILAGAALGGLIGWGVPKLHESDRASLAVIPGLDGPVVSLSVRF